MGFYIAAFLLAIPSLIFSILASRLRTVPMFWLGIVFTGAIVILYLYEIDFLISCFSHIDSMFTGFVLLFFIGIPLFFLINSKLAEPKGNDDITDDYLNSIINEKDDDVDYE